MSKKFSILNGIEVNGEKHEGIHFIDLSTGWSIADCWEYEGKDYNLAERRWVYKTEYCSLASHILLDIEYHPSLEEAGKHVLDLLIKDGYELISEPISHEIMARLIKRVQDNIANQPVKDDQGRTVFKEDVDPEKGLIDDLFPIIMKTFTSRGHKPGPFQCVDKSGEEDIIYDTACVKCNSYLRYSFSRKGTMVDQNGNQMESWVSFMACEEYLGSIIFDFRKNKHLTRNSGTLHSLHIGMCPRVASLL